MRVATFNVNNVVSQLPQLIAWLDVTRPDVVCLQEIKATQAAFPANALHEAGYASLVHGQKTWNGVAILARGAEPIEIRRGLPGDRRTSRRATWRRLSVASWSVAFTCPTAIRSPVRSSTTSWHGSSGCIAMRRAC